MFISLALLEAQPQPTQATTPSGTAFQMERGAGSLEYPSGWTSRHYSNVYELWNVPAAKLASLTPEERDGVARIEMSVTPVANHAEALHRLQEIEAEYGMTSRYVSIGGWPGLVRRQLVPKPHEGDDTASDGVKLFMVTTAVAAGATLVRLDGFAPETASPELVDQMESIGRSWRPATAGDPATADRELQQLRNSPSLRMPHAPPPGALRVAAAAGAPASANAAGNSVTPTVGPAVNLGIFDLKEGSESEVAVSSTGSNIVVAQQCSYRFSTDGGATFSLNGGYPGSGGNCTGGDSSLAVGQSGDFYWSTIGSNTSTCPPSPPATSPNCNNTQQIAQSINSGQSFSFSANVIDCQVTSGCGFGNVPDQEHIGADRVTASGSGQDQVYLVFRKGFGFGISCSTDGAATWKAVAFYNNGSSDFPRITVSQNGTVFVITMNGNNVEIWSFGSCQSGLALGLNHVTVASGINQVTCPVSGLDRCNNGNVLTSPTVAVDDTNANHLYAAYAVSTSAPPSNTSFPGNENILVQESTTGGSSWSSSVTVNQGTGGTGGRRFQPWVCVTGGTAYVSWLDRRNSTSGSNDLTDYFSSSAFDSGGILTGGTDFQIDTNADAQCATGWGCQSRSIFDSESCSTQPQFGGACGTSNPLAATDSGTPCNFASPVCTKAGETCQLGGGCPKYADYTGNACLLGRLYNAWPSATNQPGAAPTGGNIVSFFAETVVGSTGTTTTYTGPSTGEYNHSVTLSATLYLSGTAVPLPAGQTITFTLGAQGCLGSTNASGVASCSFTINQIPGPYTVQASFVASGNYQASSDSEPFTITREITAVTFTASSSTTQDYHDLTTVQAQLSDPGLGTPITVAGLTLNFAIGSGITGETCSAPTDITGTATCSLTPEEAAGLNTLKVSFTQTAVYTASSNSTPFTIKHEETTTAFTASSPTVIANGHPVTFSATLLEDGTTPPIPFGQTLTFTLGTGLTAQSCNGTVSATGLASCTIASVNQPLGPNTVGVNFAGDAFYSPSSASEAVIDFAFLNQGSFVLGNSTDTGAVEFWGDDWATVNLLTGGPAPNSFKGFANPISTNPPACGDTWISRTGNSTPPPNAPLPSYMGVVVSTTVSQSGPTVSGNVASILVVNTYPGYAPDPGHHGTGTVVATYCK
jgi:hypothetical protein